MAEYHAVVEWERDGRTFTDGKYDRGHRWAFDEGLIVPASASPMHVPRGCAPAAAVDPEEAFVAALSSCHMLFFLWLASKQKFVVDSYRDAAVGVMGKDTDGRMAMVTVTLRPEVRFGGERRPTRAELDALHHAAHEECYIARSVRTEVRCEPVTA
jgi:organic hydroperoxide reductase OsmC/OhrA